MFNLRNHLHYSALIEGISYLVLLFIAMPLKYFADSPAAVRYAGMLHGILFIWYVLSVLWALAKSSLSYKNSFLALFASIIPFATFYADKKLFSTIPGRNARD